MECVLLGRDLQRQVLVSELHDPPVEQGGRIVAATAVHCKASQPSDERGMQTVRRGFMASPRRPPFAPTASTDDQDQDAIDRDVAAQGLVLVAWQGRYLGFALVGLLWRALTRTTAPVEMAEIQWGAAG